MEPVLFYGVPGGCSLASIIALEWLGQPYKLCRIEMLEQPWPAAFSRFNPRMKTPALRLGGGGASLTESAAILQHIGARGVKQGLGFRQGTLESDRLTEMLSYLTTDFFAAFAPLWKSYEGQGLGEERKQQMRADGSTSARICCIRRCHVSCSMMVTWRRPPWFAFPVMPRSATRVARDAGSITPRFARLIQMASSRPSPALPASLMCQSDVVVVMALLRFLNCQ